MELCWALLQKRQAVVIPFHAVLHRIRLYFTSKRGELSKKRGFEAGSAATSLPFVKGGQEGFECILSARGIMGKRKISPVPSLLRRGT